MNMLNLHYWHIFLNTQLVNAVKMILCEIDANLPNVKVSWKLRITFVPEADKHCTVF